MVVPALCRQQEEGTSVTQRMSCRQVFGTSSAGFASTAPATAGLDGTAPARRVGAHGADATPAADDDQGVIDEILAGSRYRPSCLGAYIADCERGGPVFIIRGDEWFLAASATKLFPVSARSMRTAQTIDVKRRSIRPERFRPVVSLMAT